MTLIFMIFYRKYAPMWCVFWVLVLVTEVAHACEHHGDAVLVGSGDGLFITHRAAGLNDAFDASGGGIVNAVTEWEEGI